MEGRVLDFVALGILISVAIILLYGVTFTQKHIIVA